MLRSGEVSGGSWSSRFLGRWLGAELRAGDPASFRHDEAVTVAIGSGKGGTGKSFLATSLAVVAANPHPGPRFAPRARHAGERGPRVGLVDCDFGLACDHLLLGVKPQRTLHHVLTGAARIDEAVVETEFGPALIPGGSGVQRLANLDRAELAVLGSEIGAFARQRDVVFLDVGAGISPSTLLPLMCADHVVLVTQPEIAALTDAYALIKCLSAHCRRSPFSIVVNRVGEPGQGDQTFEKLAKVARRFTGVDLHYLGEVLEDPAVTHRRLGQPPLVAIDPKCHTARAIQTLHDRLRAIVGSFSRRAVLRETCFATRFRAALDQIR